MCIRDSPRVVGGINEESSRRAVGLYRHIVRGEITPTDLLTAEMAKVVENACRDVNIAFANEVALACERMGVNAYEVRSLINTRPDRDMHIPGAGVGGHCLPKDSWLLNYGLETYGKAPARQDGRCLDRLQLIPKAREINDAMPAHMRALIEEALEETGRELGGSKVTVLGAAYLENADDARNTPAAALAELLVKAGAEVVVHDPLVREAEWLRALASGVTVPLTDDLWAALSGADCAALVTRHKEYLAMDLAEVARTMRKPALVDGRNAFDLAECTTAGFVIRAIGKG